MLSFIKIDCCSSVTFIELKLADQFCITGVSDEKYLKTAIIVNQLDKRKPNGPTQYSSVKTVV